MHEGILVGHVIEIVWIEFPRELCWPSDVVRLREKKKEKKGDKIV